MSNNGSNPPAPLFNNNKSLYGSRSHTNQSSKKISIIEDKKTLQPVPYIGSSQNHLSSSNSNTQRSNCIPPPASSEPSASRMQKQIQIQKQALDAYDLSYMHDSVHQQLDEWKKSMYTRVHLMKERMSRENDRADQELTLYHRSMKTSIEENLIKKLKMMKENPQSVTAEELAKIEEQLTYLDETMESTRYMNLQLDCSNVEIVGDLQLNKLTDFSKHQPLPHPPPSPPPATSSSPTPFLQQQQTNGSSINDESGVDLNYFSLNSEPSDNQPTPPMWTDATRQGLNDLSHNVPFRLLISSQIQERLNKNISIEQFAHILSLSCQSPHESILTIIHDNNLDDAFDVLTDIAMAFKASPIEFEIRLLFQKKFAPIITGKRQERLERLKSKYKLDVIQVFPQVCPQSDERVVLLRCHQSEYMIYCLREIFQNILEQAHFTDEDAQTSYLMYDPSSYYDPSLILDYGGYLTEEPISTTLQSDNTGSTDDLTDAHQRSTNSIYSSASSLSKSRYDGEENELNFDETDHDSDDDDDSKRSRSSDDKRIIVKKLNYVKGRQVGLLIGPFGQHITQIREQTGAQIHLTNDDNEPSVIRGTRSQVKEAVRLIKECLKTQKPIPRTSYKGGRRR